MCGPGADDALVREPPVPEVGQGGRVAVAEGTEAGHRITRGPCGIVSHHFDIGRAAVLSRGPGQGTATSTSCPSSLTSKTGCLTLPLRVILPVLTSNCQPCQGQVTIVPSNNPSASGPP